MQSCEACDGEEEEINNREGLVCGDDEDVH